MKKKIRILIGGVVIIGAVFLYAHIGKTHNIYNEDIDTSEYKATGMSVNQLLEQEFECQEDTLDGIKIKCKLSGNVEPVSIEFSLKNNENGKIIAQKKVKGTEFEESKFYSLIFNTVEKCRGNSFTLTIEETGGDIVNHVDFSYTDGKEKNTQLFLNGQEQDGTLVMRTVTNRFDLETFCVLLVFIIYIACFMRFLYRLFR